jgi:hypothetical protein
MKTPALFAAALAGLLLAGPAAAPAQTAVAAPPAAGAPLRLRLGYDGRFYVKVLEMSLDEEIGADSYRSSTQMNTWGLGAVVSKLNQHATAFGRIDGGRIAPVSFSHQNIDGKKNRKISVNWTGGDVVVAATPSYDNLGDPPASRAQKLAAADPLTQLIRVTRASTADGPCSTDSHFFDGKQLYDFDFARPRPGGEVEPRERNLGLTNPVVCEVQYREVAGFKKKPPEERTQGLKGAIQARFGQLGPGGPWILSSLKAETKWGAAVIDLRRLSAGGPPLT